MAGPGSELGSGASAVSATSVAAEEVVEVTRKSARAVLRLDTRLGVLEERLGALDERLEAVGADVRSLLARTPRADEELWAPLMDALDRLDAARDAIEGGQVEGAGAGLASIGGRLEQVLAAAGYERHGQRGGRVDGRLHRVVGTIELPGAAEGSVGRVVRAPVTRGEKVVRTGEVLAVQRSNSNGNQTS